MEQPNLKEIIASSPYIFTIGVAGDSGSGKTTFTDAVRAIFGEELVSTITLDDYHTLDREGRRGQGITPLAPEANNLTLLTRHLSRLKAGEKIEKPTYDHDHGTFGPPEPFAPTKIVILEGLHTLFTPALRSLFDFTLFVDPDEGVKRAWKIRRDVQRRGYDREEVLAEMEVRKPDYEAYIAPQKPHADAIIRIQHSGYGRELGEERNVYRVTLLSEKMEKSIEDVDLSIDLFDVLSLSERNFSIEFHTEEIGGRTLGAISFDGELGYDVIRKLECEVEEQTGVHPISIFTGAEYVTPTQIIQLIISWRIIHRRIFIERTA